MSSNYISKILVPLALCIGILLLFPPYVGTYVRPGDNLSKDLGRYSIFTGPPMGDICIALMGQSTATFDETECLRSYQDPGSGYSFQSAVDYKKLLLNVFTSVLLLPILLVALSKLLPWTFIPVDRTALSKWCNSTRYLVSHKLQHVTRIACGYVFPTVWTIGILVTGLLLLPRFLSSSYEIIFNSDKAQLPVSNCYSQITKDKNGPKITYSGLVTIPGSSSATRISLPFLGCPSHVKIIYSLKDPSIFDIDEGRSFLSRVIILLLLIPIGMLAAGLALVLLAWDSTKLHRRPPT